LRPAHFGALAPVCPVCRRAGRGASPLALVQAIRTDEEDPARIVEGLVRCPHAACRREYPVIDGVPLLIADLRGHVAGGLLPLLARDDLSELTESLLGDCAGPGSELDTLRRELSTYGEDHYGDLEAEPCSESDSGAGSAVRLLAALLEAAGPALGGLPAGPALDVGCAVGRTTFELAARLGRPALGVDLNFSMLRLAQGVLGRGVARYPRRRVGVVYDRREVAADLPGRGGADFWAADAAELPFEDGRFALVAGLNVIDCVTAPRDVLSELARVLAPGGLALIATPYDWTPAATPFEQWLGGHSQRHEGRGAGEPVLRALLTPGGHAASVEGVEIVAEVDGLPWRLRLHERSLVEYRVHGVVVRKA
jgi:SAM-dependent methyltransferase/uncharacterized protein YbaR (Trm112 family)